MNSDDPLSVFLPGDGENTVKVEWTDEELRLMSEVKPGQRSFLNTFGKGKPYNVPAKPEDPTTHAP